MGDVSQEFEAFVASLPEYAIFLLDQNGLIRTWNAGAERIKGYQASEIIGRHLSQFYTPEDQAAGRPQYLMDLAAKTGVVHDEGWRVRKDSTRFWADVTLAALRNADGTVRGYAKITRDQTSQRRAEEAVRESEEKFRLLVEGVKDYGIFMLDPTGRVVSWNRGVELINGYTADEIIGQHFGRFYPAEDLMRGKPEWELLRAAEQGQYEEEGWRLRKDGSRFWASVLITALRDPSGKLRGFAKVTRDLSERKRAQEQLIQEQMSRARSEALARRTGMLADLSQALMRALEPGETLARVGRVIIHHLADYCIVDLRAADGTLRLLATAHAEPGKEPLLAEMRRSYPAEQQPGYPTLRVFRTGISDLVREITDEMLVAAARDARHLEILRALGPTSHMVVALRAGEEIIGTLSIVSSRRERLYDAADVILAEDLAARAGLAITNAELYDRERRARGVAETMAAENARLYQEAHAAVRIRDDFIGIASHEMRTPLSALRLQIQSLLRAATREGADEGQLAKLQGAMRQIDRQTRMITQLLDFSRLVAGRIELSFEPIDFCAVVREIAERFADEAQRNKVRLDVDAPGPLIGQWDANALDQIITNIVSNAIKYGRENPVEIWAGQRDGLATLVVRDHGIGIAPEDQERVFGRFERAVSSRNYGGFGLGLWIAQQGAEAMGGRISVKSSLGQGAEFTLELPVERKERA